MSKHRRGRITVQHQPTGGERFMMKGMGLIHAVMGIIFVIVGVGITAEIGLFGLPFVLGGAFFAVNGIRMMVSRNDFAHRVGYDVETEVEGRTIAGIMEDVDRMAAEEETRGDARAEDGDVENRLRQLQSLRDSGLITDGEYESKRREILRSL